MSDIGLEEYKRLVEQQCQELLGVIQSVALGDLEVQVEIPEGIEALSELAVGLEMMVDDLREMMLEQERAMAQIEQSRRELEAALAEVTAVQRRYFHQVWEEHAAAQANMGYFCSEGDEGPTSQAWLPAMTPAVQQAEIAIEGDPAAETSLAIPLRLYGEVIGAIGFRREGSRPWSENELAIVETVAEQVALALENQRLFDEAQQATFLMSERVKALDCLNDIGRKMEETPPVPDFLQWVTDRIPLAMRHADVCLAAIEFEGQVYGAAEAVKLPRQMVQQMRIGGEAVGRVYVAYTQDYDFLDEESALLGDITRRVSGYIENRRLIEQTQAALAEVEATHRSYLRREWQDHLRQHEMLQRGGFVYDLLQADRAGAVAAVPDLWRPEMEQAIAQRDAVIIQDDGGNGRAGLAIPITVRGETIGVLGVEAPGGERQWTEDDLALIAAVSDQLGQTLETARLFADTQRRAERERLIGEITAKIRASTDIEDILETTAVELGRVLGTSRAIVRLGESLAFQDSDAGPQTEITTGAELAGIGKP